MKNNSNLNEEQLDSFANAAVQHNIEQQLRVKYGKILDYNKLNDSKKKNIIRLSSYVKVAAVVVVVLGGMFLIRESLVAPSTQSMAQNYLDQTNIPGNPDITRKGANSASQIQREANDAYMLKNYPLAASKYEELKSKKEIKPLDQFYLGISHMKTENFSAAIEVFLEIKTKDNIQIEEVDWLLSLSYVLSNREEKAIPILEKIISENGYKANEAEKLLYRIKSLL